MKTNKAHNFIQTLSLVFERFNASLMYINGDLSFAIGDQLLNYQITLKENEGYLDYEALNNLLEQDLDLVHDDLTARERANEKWGIPSCHVNHDGGASYG